MKIPILWATPLIRVVYDIWCSTLRYTEKNRHFVDDLIDNGKHTCLAIWHNELFPLLHTRKKQPMAAIVSQSRDGELLARILEGMTIKTARGSSSRGGVKALIKAVQMMRKEKRIVCITVDGPRGPRHEVKEGIIHLAKIGKAQIVPVRLFMNRYKAFNSWDRFQLPLPFSKVEIVYGEPFNPLEGEFADDKELIISGIRNLKLRMEGISSSLNFKQ